MRLPFKNMFPLMKQTTTSLGSQAAPARALRATALPRHTVRVKGTKTTWRELRDIRGFKKYSKWSFTVTVTDMQGNPLTCTFIKVKVHKYRLRKVAVQTNTSRLYNETKNKAGWHDLKLEVTVNVHGAEHTHIMRLK